MYSTRYLCNNHLGSLVLLVLVVVDVVVGLAPLADGDVDPIDEGHQLC